MIATSTKTVAAMDYSGLATGGSREIDDYQLQSAISDFTRFLVSRAINLQPSDQDS